MGVIYVISMVSISVYYVYITIIKSADEVYIEKRLIPGYKMHYAVIIPCFNEEKVIKETLLSLLRFSTPNLTIYVVDDDSADGTLKVINGVSDPRIKVIRKKKPDAQKGKGHSLNLAYKNILQDYRSIDSEQVIVTVLDADGFLCADAFTIADRIFSHADIHGIQARVRIINNYKSGNWLTLLQDIEFYEVIGNIQKLRMKTKTVGLGGNGQLTRLSVLKKFDGIPWSDCLLEDYDLTVRLLLNNEQIVYTDQLIIYQQGVTSYQRYIKQRSRWIQGSLQCHSYMFRILKTASLSKIGKLEMFYFLLQPYYNLANSIILLISIKLLSQSIVEGITFKSVLTIILMAFITVYPGLSFSKRYIKETQDIEIIENSPKVRSYLGGMLMYLYIFLTIPSILLAFVRQLIGKKSWIKTQREEKVYNE
ncbi:hypothetical protein ATZ33_10045 [Enterococcus silesiacus]|uniref:Glycosyltransferase 2-like domain-containing protein n=1 Tax=Enterococcus silesiacus TaxID=332949 RepID=A0A0S3KBN4_9ENTE|nr:glycosyltransferase family 2 protein [Enterococcus silesiacus]ALS01699.1 hypothetical protein ATZ33_10045 [Enterococcus silesiacus]OJG91398.1 hypothetical protein RV15_GL000675 [Enterococcus silesiacus]